MRQTHQPVSRHEVAEIVDNCIDTHMPVTPKSATRRLPSSAKQASAQIGRLPSTIVEWRADLDGCASAVRLAPTPRRGGAWRCELLCGEDSRTDHEADLHYMLARLGCRSKLLLQLVNGELQFSCVLLGLEQPVRGGRQQVLLQRQLVTRAQAANIAAATQA